MKSRSVQEMPHSRRGWQQLVASTRASALPEYAVIVALVVVSGAIAYAVAGSSIDRTFVLAARFVEPAADTQPTSRAARDTDGRPSPAQDNAPAGAVDAQQWLGTLLAVGLGFMVWIALVAIGIVVRRELRRRWLDRLSRIGGNEPLVMPLAPSAFERLAEKRQQIGRILSRDIEDSSEVHTQVRHLMSKHLAVVAPETLVADALAIMEKEHIRHLLVCQHTGPLMGIISDRDMKQRTGACVSDIMTASPTVVPPEMPVGHAITLMLTRNISCLPVVHEGATCGVLTTTDVLLSCQCMVQVLERVASGLCLPHGTRISDADLAWDQDDQLSGTVTQ